MALTPQWLDALRARITLSALVGRSVRLTKAGREFRACCPFHDEKTPSFYVNDAKGFYHCFGCQAHGDAIRWLTDHQGLAFMDAVKELAGEAGLEVPAPRSARGAASREARQPDRCDRRGAGVVRRAVEIGGRRTRARLSHQARHFRRHDPRLRLRLRARRAAGAQVGALAIRRGYAGRGGDADRSARRRARKVRSLPAPG